MRITGLATGLDMDEVIKESMRPYRIKIQQQQQQKEIVEIKQKLYRDVLKDSREFYNKYFDVSKSDSIVLSKNWSTIKFESSDSNVVSVSSNSEAINKNFTIKGSSATATKATLTEGIGEGDKIVVDGKEFTLIGSTDRERASNLNKELQKAGIKVSVSYTDFAGEAINKNFTIKGSSATATKATLTEGIGEGDKIVVDGKEFTLIGSTDRERASNLNKELQKAGIKVSVSYTDFAGSVDGENKKGLVFESTVLGEKGTFTLGGSIQAVNIEEVNGSNATEAKFTGITIENIRNSKEIKIGDKVISLNLDPSKEYAKDELISELNKKLEEEKIDFRAKVNEENNVTLTSTKSGELADLPTLEITLEDSSIVNGTFENGKNATPLVKSINLSDVEGKVLFINGSKIELSLKEDGSIDNDALNSLLEEKKLNVSAEIKDGKLSLISKTNGEGQSIDVSVVEKPTEGFVPVIQGKDANIIIEDSKGGVYTHKGDSNTVTLDGVTFKFNGKIPADGIKVTGTKDVTKTKEMVVNFFNDYNEEVKGSNATEAKFTGITIENIKDSKEIKIGDKVISLNLDSSKEYTHDELISELNKKREEEKIDFRAKVDEDDKVTLVSAKSGELTDLPTLEIALESGSLIKGTFKNGKNATPLVKSMNLSDVEGKVLFINGSKIELPLKEDGSIDNDALNSLLEERKLNVSAEIKEGKLSLISKANGEGQSIDVRVVEKPAAGFIPVIQGKDANIIIEDSKGGVYTHKGDSNTVTLDGVTFKFNGKIPADGIKVTGTKDVTKTKEMVVNFFNDYNKLMEKLNTLTMEKRDRSYSPLTDEQKKEMSESEIKLWNERVEKGQLSRDSDLSRIINSLKSAMTTMVDGIDINLEDIGVKPVSDYGGVKNGTFTIDEDKLTAALEEDTDKVMRLFTATPTDSKDLTSAEKNSKSGIAQRLKSILYDETMTVSARLLKKAGYEGTTTVTNNELTKSIEKYERKMEDMEKAFSKKEQALYSKYATLETMMNQLNSQQSYLLSQLGMA